MWHTWHKYNKVEYCKSTVEYGQVQVWQSKLEWILQLDWGSAMLQIEEHSIYIVEQNHKQ